MKKMNEGILWGIPYHSWPCPAHHFTDGLALFRSIAMGRTILASCLLFAIRAMIKTTTSEVCQMQVFIRHCVLMKMMATIQLNHLTDYSLLLLNPGHFILPYFISSPCLSYCLRLPTGGSVRVIRMESRQILSCRPSRREPYPAPPMRRWHPSLCLLFSSFYFFNDGITYTGFSSWLLQS